ncbi:MAG: hypothetical protein RBU21_16175 [FCB group bacterium]|nr:hypothetical protein [FCB group bacterium]
MRFICDHPGMFGETEENLRSLYARYRERFRQDGRRLRRYRKHGLEQ